MNLSNVDEEGWTYATDFSEFINIDSGSRIKSMMHFVRRRVLIRFQYYDGNLL